MRAPHLRCYPMNAPSIHVTGETFPTMRRLWFLGMAGLASALLVYGAADGGLWVGGGTALGQGTLLLSVCALIGIVRWLERRSDRLSDAVRRLPKYPLILLDKNGRVTRLSDSLGDMTGREPSDFVGTDPWETVFARDGLTERFMTRIRALCQAGGRGLFSGEVTAKGADSRTFPVSVTFAPLFPDYTGGALHVCDLNRSEQVEREVEAGRRVEDALLGLLHELFLPEAPGRMLMGATLSVSSVAGKHASGDFFECLPWNGCVCDVVVGDVMGRGLAAALASLEAKSGLLQAVISLVTRDGNARLPEVSQVVCEMRRFVAKKLAVKESFITLCYARFDFEERHVSWVDCGHAPILHWQASTRKAVLLKGANTPIGFAFDEPYQVFRAGFAVGDVLMICSDGIIEARNPGGETFGVERLVSVVEESAELPVHEIGRSIRMRLAEFTRSCKETAEEQTIVAVRVHEAKSTHCRRKWDFDCPSQLSVLSQFRQQIRGVYAAPDVARSVASSEAELMLLALHEVFVNIIGHSIQDQGSTAPLIHLEACLFEDRMEWTFMHGLSFFSPTRIHTPSDDGSQSDGYGLFIIEQIADSVRYYRNERGESCVNLIKCFHPDPAGGSTGEASV